MTTEEMVEQKQKPTGIGFTFVLVKGVKERSSSAFNCNNQPECKKLAEIAKDLQDIIAG
jgi:hypothetical protein